MVNGYMSYPTALAIVNRYGSRNDCDSLIGCISDMEDNRDNLLPSEVLAMDIVMGELVAFNTGE